MASSKDMVVIKDDKWLNDLIGITNDVITKLLKGIYESVSYMLHNGVTYTIVMIAIMFWLLNILKNGYPTRREIFNAGKWLFMVCFVMGIFSSYSAYESFISWLMIPAQWVRGGAMGTSTGSDIARTAGQVGMGGAVGAGLAYGLSRIDGGGIGNFIKSIGSAIGGGFQGSVNATPGGKTLQKASGAMIGGVANQAGNVGSLAGKAYKAFKGGFAAP